MLARIRKSMDEKEEGFTLIELLVVMIIIGILAAIAIPVFLNQRKKAQDSSAKADVSTIGKEIATWYVDNTAAPVVAVTAAGRYGLADTAANALLGPADIGKQGAGNTLLNQFYSAATVSPPAWCVTVKNTGGDKAVTGIKYSSTNGLVVGAACADENS